MFHFEMFELKMLCPCICSLLQQILHICNEHILTGLLLFLVDDLHIVVCLCLSKLGIPMLDRISGNAKIALLWLDSMSVMHFQCLSVRCFTSKCLS